MQDSFLLYKERMFDYNGDMEPIIFHVDVNSAFLSWEAVSRLKHQAGATDLRTIPAAVGGDVKKRRGIILARSLPAKQYGVRTGETVAEARKKCPELVLVPPSYGLYERASGELMGLLKEYSPRVEPFSIDEAFMDMTGMELLLGTPRKAAENLREEIRTRLGFTVNIGISSNKLLAKMASDFEKPDRVHTLFPEEIQEKMWCLPVRDLFLVGPSTERKLNRLGIRTIGELACTDVEVLRANLKKHGEIIWNFANGRDASLVEEEPQENKGYGNSTTIAFDVTDRETACQVLLSLTETVAARLRKHGKKAELVSVSIRDTHMHTVSHQMILPSATDITSELYLAVRKLFDELWNGEPIRHLGVYTGRLGDGEGRQLSLFDRTDYGKLERLDAALDRIRMRHGRDAVMRASFLGTPLDHMAGKMRAERKERNNGEQKQKEEQEEEAERHRAAEDI